MSVLGPTDFLLNPLNQPVPKHWTVVQDEDFVLVVALYQSHLAEDMLAAPASRLDDGIIHLIYVKAGISRRSCLRLFLAMEKGGHLNTNCPHVVYVKVKALRLEPYSPKGIITVDGELVNYGLVQAQIHGSRIHSFSYNESRRGLGLTSYKITNKSSTFALYIVSQVF